MKKIKNKNGKGSVYKVSEQKWVAKICIGTFDNGKPKIKQFSGKTESSVRKKLNDYRKNADSPVEKVSNKIMVYDYFETWLKEYQLNKLKPSSFDRLESTVRNHIYPYFGKYSIDKITMDQVQELINYLYNNKSLSFSSIKKVFNALNSCFTHALIYGTIFKNPCIGVVLPSQSERTKTVKSFTPEETEILKYEFLHDDCYMGHAFMLILNTGMRMGEALALRWENVDFSNKIISIGENVVLVKNRDENGNALSGYSVKMQKSLKTESGKRIIPLNNTALSSLEFFKKRKNSEYVISNGNCNAVKPSNFERHFHIVLKRAGIEKCGVHTLRHTFASMLFQKGVDIKIISKILGHSSVKITYDTYIHLTQQDVSHVTDLLD